VELTDGQYPHVVGISGKLPIGALSIGKPRKTQGVNQVVSRSARDPSRPVVKQGRVLTPDVRVGEAKPPITATFSDPPTLTRTPIKRKAEKKAAKPQQDWQRYFRVERKATLLTPDSSPSDTPYFGRFSTWQITLQMPYIYGFAGSRLTN